EFGGFIKNYNLVVRLAVGPKVRRRGGMALSPINPGRGIDQNQHLNHEHPMMEVQRKNDGQLILCDGSAWA
ncbi:PREDICTED: LOC18771323, partial [Prunus dulcis]